jgi:hypothetical protein
VQTRTYVNPWHQQSNLDLEDFVMRRYACVLFAASLIVYLGQGALVGQDKEKSTPQEQTVQAYDSATHGALEVSVDDKSPTDSFAVLQKDKDVKGSPKLLNTTLELAPGDYVVAVNKTYRKIKIEAGKKYVLLTGQLKVEGNPATMAWYAMDGNVKLTSSGVEPLLNKAMPLFAGTYAVYVDTSLTEKDQSLGKAEVKVGQITVLKR